MKLIRAVLVCAACLAGIQAQTAFDAASVKAASGGAIRDEVALFPGRLHASDVRVRALIAEAYQVTPAQISGPEWLTTEAYNVDAKSAGPATMAQTRAMLQALLADRFQLTVRRGTREMDGYVLSLASGRSAQLAPADPAGCRPDPSPDNPCQRIATDSASFVFTGERVSMAQLCRLVEKLLWYPVTDRTGLEGVYNWKLDLSAFLSGDRTDGLAVTARALREQLGLKLERSKGPVEMIVVEHIARPSPN